MSCRRGRLGLMCVGACDGKSVALSVFLILLFFPFLLLFSFSLSLSLSPPPPPSLALSSSDTLVAARVVEVNWKILSSFVRLSLTLFSWKWRATPPLAAQRAF